MAHTLQLISGTSAASSHAASIIRVLFDNTHARRLNAHLASGQTDVVLAALKVLNAAALVDHKSTYEAIAWTAKVYTLCLPYMSELTILSSRRFPNSFLTDIVLQHLSRLLTHPFAPLSRHFYCLFSHFLCHLIYSQRFSKAWPRMMVRLSNLY